MGAVLIPQLVDVVDTVAMTLTQSSGTVRRLTSCHIEPSGLYLEFPTPEEPETEAETCWLLPRDGLRLATRRSRSRPEGNGSSVLTAVRIEHDARYWRITDMLLGLAVTSGSVPRFTNSEHFAAAASSGLLRADDADVALRVVQRALEQLTADRHDLVSWLAGRGITRLRPSL